MTDTITTAKRFFPIVPGDLVAVGNSTGQHLYLVMGSTSTTLTIEGWGWYAWIYRWCMKLTKFIGGIIDG